MKTQTFFLKIYAISLTFILGYMVITGFNSNSTSEKFDEITVERINIVESKGDLKWSSVIPKGNILACLMEKS